MKQSFKKLSTRLLALAGVGGVLAAGIVAAFAASAPLVKNFNIPLYFEENIGQGPEGVRFLSRGEQQTFYISPAEVVVSLTKVTGAPTGTRENRAIEGRTPVQTRNVRLQFVGANARGVLSGESPLPGKVNYLRGSDQAQWHVGVSTFSKVEVDGLYRGVDVLYYGNQHQLEYDFTVAPGADPSAITMHFEGADAIRIDPQGVLVLKLGDAEIRQPKPSIYQVVDGQRKKISGGYRLKDASTVVFSIGDYDHSLPLIIDPILTYSTFFGGTGNDIAWATALDPSGFVYMAGETMSPQVTNFTGAFQTNFAGGALDGDAFVAKFSNDASSLIYFTYLGGVNNDGAYGLAVDGAGYAYVTGFTQSTNFPRKSLLLVSTNGTSSYTNMNSPFDTRFHDYRTDAFITKLAPNGAQLVYSLYLGGTSTDAGFGVALDAATNVYVTGFTFSTNFPTVNPFQGSLAGSNDVFLTKISADASAVLYSTYFGGGNYDEGLSVAVDSSQFAYVTGFTYSTNFYNFTNGGFGGVGVPTLNNTPMTTPPLFLNDGFVTKFDTVAGGVSSIAYSAIIAGNNNEIVSGIALDSGNNAYVVGYSQSTDYTNFGNTITVTNLHDGAKLTNGPNQDAFLTKLDPSGNRVFTAVFGGSGNDGASAVGLDAAGDIFVAGYTGSVDFPTNSANNYLRSFNDGGEDAFVMAVNSTCSSLLYSVYLGGAANDFAYGLATDPAGNAFVVGKTSSGDFPTTNAPPSAFRGVNDAFLSKISLPPPLMLTITMNSTNVVLSWPNTQPEYTQYNLQGNASMVGTWTNIMQVPLMTNGFNYVTVDTNSGPFFRLIRP